MFTRFTFLPGLFCINFCYFFNLSKDLLFTNLTLCVLFFRTLHQFFERVPLLEHVAGLKLTKFRFAWQKRDLNPRHTEYDSVVLTN